MRPVLVFVAMIAFFVIGFFFIDARDDLDSARENLIGKWQSTQDEKFSRVFKDNGRLIDSYEGSEIRSDGYWALFTKDMSPEGYEGILEGGAIYLSIGVPRSEHLYFKVRKVDANALELTYLNRGGTLSFKKSP